MSVVFGAAFASERPGIVGHRGGRGESWPPENTIAAFGRAVANGADAIELDVRTCAGGDVVVMHDADLARMTGGADRRAIASVTRAELARIGLTGGRADVSAEPAPSLDELLEWAKGRTALNVEAKHDVPDRLALARNLARTLARHGAGVEILLSSFDPVLLAMLAVATPATPRAWLTHDGQHRWERAWTLIAQRAPIDAVHLERTQASPRAVAAFRSARKRVGVWTVNDPDEARDLAAIGVDWIITDDASAIGAGLGRAGLSRAGAGRAGLSRAGLSRK